MNKLLILLAAFLLAACSDEAKQQEIAALEAEKANLETSVESAKASLQKLEEAESAKAADLKRLDMQP